MFDFTDDPEEGHMPAEQSDHDDVAEKEEKEENGEEEGEEGRFSGCCCT